MERKREINKIFFIGLAILFLLVPTNLSDPPFNNHCTEMHIHQMTVCIKGEIE